jgi:glycosyl hydrolase family 113/VCBS repeat protein/FG-GAP repeat protein
MRPLVLFACIAVATALGVGRPAAQGPATPPSLTYKGFNYVSYYNGAYENADSLPALVTTGANAVALDIEYGIDVVNSAVYADANYTDSLTALAGTITKAKGRGLAVMARPLIDFLDPAKIGTYSVGDWRSFYNPTNPAAFFTSYQSMIVAVAQVAQANGATMLCIGAELDQLAGPAYLGYWSDIITAVRAVFSGTLVYSANWDTAISPWQGQHGLTAGTGDLTTQISFWSALDFVGIDEYAPLSDKASPVLADLLAGWTQVPSDPTALAVTGNQSLISYFDEVATTIGKPLFFTEIGYESASDAASQPAGSSTNIYDPGLQAKLYAAFFDAWQQSGNGALIGLLFWNWDPNAAEVGPGNGANFSPQALPAQRVATAAFTGRSVNTVMTATHDFDGDTQSDIAWRNTNGDFAIWLMTVNTTGAAQVLSSADYSSVPTSWQLVGQRDFNGDGKADLLWSNSNGDTSIWLMNGTTVSSTSDLGIVGNGWSIVGTGDFNGDGYGDILWRNTNGDTSVWLMTGNATQVQVLSATDLGSVSTSWSVAQTGDFNGDGKADILWHNSNGDTSIWLLTANGTQTQVLSTTDLGVVPTSWNVINTGDFNGDGTSDILWHNSNGNTSIWLMTSNGTQIQVLSTTGLGGVPTSWNIAATGDFNGDGKSDILWRNSNGDTSIWFMTVSGTHMQVLSTSDLGGVPTSWLIQNAGAD